MKKTYADPKQLFLFDEVQPENKNNRKIRRIRKGDASSYPAQLDLPVRGSFKKPRQTPGFLVFRIMKICEVISVAFFHPQSLQSPS
jgi:hypothetical protein